MGTFSLKQISIFITCFAIGGILLFFYSTDKKKIASHYGSYTTHVEGIEQEQSKILLWDITFKGMTGTIEQYQIDCQKGEAYIKATPIELKERLGQSPKLSPQSNFQKETDSIVDYNEKIIFTITEEGNLECSIVVTNNSNLPVVICQDSTKIYRYMTKALDQSCMQKVTEFIERKPKK